MLATAGAHLQKRAGRRGIRSSMKCGVKPAVAGGRDWGDEHHADLGHGASQKVERPVQDRTEDRRVTKAYTSDLYIPFRTKERVA